MNTKIERLGCECRYSWRKIDLNERLKLGIMQPYFVPYIGYWQLLNAVDIYVIYDDVNYINRGWINRNRILIDGCPKYFNIPLKGASQNKLINEIEVDNDRQLVHKNLRRIEGAYKRAPYFIDVFPVVREILECDDDNLASYLVNSIKIVCDYLDITTDLIVSSTLKKDCSLRGKDKILSICKLLGAKEYYNTIAGAELYSVNEFCSSGITLEFLKTDKYYYKQFTYEFQDNLSIIDVMMFNSKKQIKELLQKYSLVSF